MVWNNKESRRKYWATRLVVFVDLVLIGVAFDVIINVVVLIIAYLARIEVAFMI